MPLASKQIVLLTLAAAFVTPALAWPASAKQICGWYAIAYCSVNQAAVSKFANNGWGTVIKTSHFQGFARGQFCAVSGPQSKSSALQDRRNAIGNGVSNDIYIKRACADERYIGD